METQSGKACIGDESVLATVARILFDKRVCELMEENSRLKLKLQKIKSMIQEHKLGERTQAGDSEEFVEGWELAHEMLSQLLANIIDVEKDMANTTFSWSDDIPVEERVIPSPEDEIETSIENYPGMQWDQLHPF